MIAGSTVMAEPLAKAKAVGAMALKLYSTLKMRRGGASGNQGRGTQKRKFCVDAALSQNMPINLLVEDETLPLSSEMIQH